VQRGMGWIRGDSVAAVCATSLKSMQASADPGLMILFEGRHSRSSRWPAAHPYQKWWPVAVVTCVWPWAGQADLPHLPQITERLEG
jgi:hypothetical protein